MTHTTAYTMTGITKSELLKTKHTSARRLVLAAPVLTLLLGSLLSGASFQLASCNWWYSIILPVILAVWSAGSISREKRTSDQNLLTLPVRPESVWLGKALSSAFFLFGSCIILGVGCAIPGFITQTIVPPLGCMIGCLLLFLTFLWQIPFTMLLSCCTGYLPAILITFTGNILFLTPDFTEQGLFYLNPFAIPSRILYPFFQMRSNGLPLPADSPLLVPDHTGTAVGLSLALFLFLLLTGSKIYKKLKQ